MQRFVQRWMQRLIPPPPIDLLFAVFISAGGMALLIIATSQAVEVPEEGSWNLLEICSDTHTTEEHYRLLSRMNAASRVWIKEQAILALSPAPGIPGCSKVRVQDSSTFLVRGEPEELIKVIK